METKILSPINNNPDYCFQSEDPATGITSYLDYETGYTSNSKLAVDSEYVSDAESNQPKLVTELKVIDALRGIIWYPSVINIPGQGMIFPMGTKEEWTWEVMKVRDVTEEEKEKYPLPDKEGEYFKTILDVKGKLNFSKDKFIDALKEIGGVVDTDE
jgi:hypothetical protein|tara:strand:+ start:116 stop:586 length:471 start_codon:yes stop_codon:yes gene_type:complete